VFQQLWTEESSSRFLAEARLPTSRATLSGLAAQVKLDVWDHAGADRGDIIEKTAHLNLRPLAARNTTT
jgi:hypothetical protein